MNRVRPIEDPDTPMATEGEGPGAKMLMKAKSVKFAFEDGPANGPVVHASDGKALSRTASRTNTMNWLGGGSRRSNRRRWKKLMQTLNPRYWLHVANKRLPIILPHQRRSWDLFILILVVYNAVMVPYEVGFGEIAVPGLRTLDNVIDALFWMDLVSNFRTAYVDHQANMIRDGGRIAQHYLWTWFPIDFCASFPFDSFILLFVDNVSQEGLIALSLTRTPRLLRLGRLLRFFDRMKAANVVRMIRLLFFMALVAHWVSCMWFLLYRLFHKTLEWSFDQLGQTASITDFLHAYLNSFLLMIGNDVEPQNNVERLYCTGILVIGACFYAIVVGHMSLLVNNMNPTASRHKYKKDIINNTVRYLGAPPAIASRIDQYFDYLTTYSHPGPDGMALVSQLPTSMFQDISNWMYRDLVTKVTLFKECEAAFISQLVMRLKLAVFLPKELIFRIGDVGHEMYFISKGHVAVMNSCSEMLTIVHKGGYFGELALLATSRRTAQCVALSNCDLTMLMAHDLIIAMRDFPDSAKKVRAAAESRLKELKSGGQVHEEEEQHAAPRHLKKLNPAAAAAEDEASSAPPSKQTTATGMASHGSPVRNGGTSEGATVHRLAGGGDGTGGVAASIEGANLTQGTLDLVDQVQATIHRLTGKMDALQGTMGDIHSRLARVEANAGNIFGNGAGGGGANKSSIFDVDF